ncbi:MAG: hypothetical protein ACYTGU_19015 [Planctomycetota bacterium]|jgi:hypothetical protein
MPRGLVCILTFLALGAGCAGTRRSECKAAWTGHIAPTTEFRFVEGGGMVVRQDGVVIVRVEIRDGRFVYLGRDLGAYPPKTPVRFLADGTILIGDREVDPSPTESSE